MVEFKDEEFVKKALETMNKYDLSGRPLNIKEVSFLYLQFKLELSEHASFDFFSFFSSYSFMATFLRIDAYKRIVTCDYFT